MWCSRPDEPLTGGAKRCILHHMKLPPPHSPPAEHEPESKASVRLTITVTPEVHAAFSRLSKASGMSLGRTMGEWLHDTVDAAKFMAETMEKARAAPRLVAQELHAYAMGMADETGTLLERVKELGRADRAAASAAAGRSGPHIPPSGNTGGKGPESTTRKHGGRG